LRQSAAQVTNFLTEIGDKLYFIQNQWSFYSDSKIRNDSVCRWREWSGEWFI